MNKQEIQAKHLVLHDALGSRKEAVDKELFDQQHRKVWTDCDVELRVRKSELEAKSSLTSNEAKEVGELRMMFPAPS